MGISVIPVVMVALLIIIIGNSGLTLGCRVGKRTEELEEYPEVSTNEDLPVIVPKRAALLFDQLMVALQKVVDQERDMAGNRAGSKSINKPSSPRYPSVNSEIFSTDDQTMDLKRRGQPKNNQVYWRCYFNAVTCFKKK